MDDGLPATAALSTDTVEALVFDALPERADAATAERWLAAAADRLQQHGAAIIRNAISPDVIGRVLAEARRRHAIHMQAGQRRLFRNFQSDPLRAQVPVAIEGAVADPAVFEAPSIAVLAQALLGPDYIIGECGIVISHAGAGPQNTHRDSNFLFGGRADELALPPFAMTLLIPLVDVALGMGPTEIWPGTHRHVDEAITTTVPPLSMPLAAGTVVLLDARVLHRGGANVSGPVRPSLYLSYHRSWYLETYGYEQKPPVRITPAMLRRLPEAHRRRFAWALRSQRFGGLPPWLYTVLGRVSTLWRRLRG